MEYMTGQMGGADGGRVDVDDADLCASWIVTECWNNVLVFWVSVSIVEVFDLYLADPSNLDYNQL